MTSQAATVTVDLGDARGARELTIAEVQQAIGGYYNVSNYHLAASVSVQVAEQLPAELWPQFAAAETLYQHQEIERAFQYIDRALAIDPQHVASLVIKSRLHLYSGDQEQALRTIDAAIDLLPRDSRIHSIKGELQVGAGQIEPARASFQVAIELNPRNTDALEQLSRLPGDDVGDELLKKIEFLIHSRQLDRAHRGKAHFALAQIYDKRGDVARHFAHLRAGNDLENAAVKFDRGAPEREARRLIDYFSAPFFRDRKAPLGDPANIIFIVGFPRCGSTLVEQILSCHPLVSAAGETYALKHAIRDFQSVRHMAHEYPRWIGAQTDDALAEIADDYRRRVAKFDQNEFLTDKMLDNYKFVGVIHLIFPGAKIIDMQRNPIDVCYSCYKRLFERGSLPSSYNLENLAIHYRAYRQVMRHWHTVLPGRMHTVQYEELVGSQEEVTRGLLEYCRLTWDETCLDFHRNARTVRTSSNVQVRQPLYTESIDRWKEYREYLGPLLDLVND